MSVNTTDQLLEKMPWLDQAAELIKAVYEPVAGESAPRKLKDALVGTWLGHPLHPAVILMPIGCWTSSLILDIAGEKEASDLLIASGLVSAAGAAVTGAAQYYDATTNEKPRRLGALHAITNAAAMGLYGASLLARKRGNRGAGVALSTAGFAALMAGGYLGGHLSYVLGIGVDHAAFEQPPAEWTDVAAADDLEPGTPRRVEIDGAAVMLLAREDGIHAIGAICPHLGGPLDEGQIEGDAVTCPWHGSVFRVSDGALQHGPSATAAKAYDVKTEGSRVFVRELTGAGRPDKGKPLPGWQTRLAGAEPPPAVGDWVDSLSAENQPS